MELIKTYDGKITDRKPVNFDDLESLDNSDVILLTEDEISKFEGLKENPQNVQKIKGAFSMKHIREVRKTLEIDRNREKKKKELCEKFCAEAKKRKVKFEDMHSFIAKIINGQRMTEKEMKAGDFMGEPETFWNPLKHGIDYNFFKDNYEQIQKMMS